jgi:type IV pilus assembly protein PilA
MKQCPRCRKNLVDSAVACTFCRHPLAAPGASARGDADERSTLNPFVLFGRCFRLSGSFGRVPFAVVYLGAIAAFWGVAFLVPFALALLGASDAFALRGTTFAVMAMLPVVLVAAFGGSIRRWHDLGKPGWYALLWAVPCVNGIAILYLLLAPGVRERAGRGSTPGWLVAAVLTVVAVFGVGVVAAIAIPSLLRARVTANEAAAIGDLRVLLSAEAAYQRVNGGYYEGRLACLAAPAAGCLPGYPPEGTAFIETALAAAGPRHGYAGRLDAAVSPAVDPARSSPTSVPAFAYVLRPVQPGQTGLRSFCGDSTGFICFRSDGSDIAAEGGACPRSVGACAPLR